MKSRIPLWINVLQALILAILAFQTYAGYFNPRLLYAGFVADALTFKLITTLAGRNAVMLVISVLALARQEARFYAFAFLMHALREAQDMVLVPLTLGLNPAALGFAAVFLIVFVIPEIAAYFKLNQIARGLPTL